MSESFRGRTRRSFSPVRLFSSVAQKITLGVIAGASLTDDYRNTSFTSGEGGLYFGDGATLHLTNASQWFIFGPTVEVAFSKRFSVEVDAIRRRIRSTSLMILGTPLEYPDGTIIRQYDPSRATTTRGRFPCQENTNCPQDTCNRLLSLDSRSYLRKIGIERPSPPVPGWNCPSGA